MSDVVAGGGDEGADAVIVYEEPGLCGLELWHGIARGATLYQLRDRKPDYFAALREFLLCLHRGQAATENPDEAVALRQAEGFTRVVVCGGDAQHEALEPAMRAAALPFTLQIRGGVYPAKQGAFHIFHKMAWRRGVALDLGQMQLKVMTVTDDHCLSRDASLLPFGADAIDPATGRARLCSFLRKGLSRVPEPDGVVLALPVALDPAGVAQPSTYPGLCGPVDAIFSDLFACPVVAINDAVLAALSFRPEGREKTLVVTLGFGLGGALWYA